MEYYWSHKTLSFLLQIRPRRGPSFFWVADKGCGGVGVGAEQGCNGVVAESRVVCCEHHLRESTDRGRFYQSLECESPSRRLLEVQCQANSFYLMVSFSGTDWTKGKNPNMQVRLHGRLVQPLEQDFFPRPVSLGLCLSFSLSFLFACFCKFTVKIRVALAWLREITESLNALVHFLGFRKKRRGSNCHLVARQPKRGDCHSHHWPGTQNCRAGREYSSHFRDK